MIDQKKIQIMIRLAILEKEHGKEIAEIRESYRSDYFGIPMLKNGLRITVVFLAVVCIWAGLQIDFLVTAMDHLKSLLICIGAAYAIVLIVTLVVTFGITWKRYQQGKQTVTEYNRLVGELAKTDRQMHKGEAV